VITGVGAITPLGHSLEETIAAVDGPAPPIGPATLFDASGFTCSKAAEVRGWDARLAFRVPKALKLTDRPAQFAVAAAGMALTDANWPTDAAASEQLGIAIGTSGSDLRARDISRALADDPSAQCVSDVSAFAERVMSRLNPLWLLIGLPNMISAHVAIQLQARGPNTTVMSDWAAGSQAIGEASDWIRSGETDAVLAGGSDSGIDPFAYATYQQAGWLQNDDGSGFIPAEGAAIVLLEEREAALKRGACVRAEIVAYATRAPHRHRRPAQTLAHTLCDAMAFASWTRRDVTLCSIAAPPAPLFADISREALRMSMDAVCARYTFDERFGFPLASAGPIDAALLVRRSPPGARVLASAVGSSHEAVTLAFEVGCAHRLAPALPPSSTGHEG
jgi:3-oxoacyl-(acyl-carrier-protein) synthase